MVGLCRNGFVLIAFGGMNLCMKLREKMETHYQKNYVKELSQPEVSTSLEYISEDIFKKKEKILKDIYPCIKFFDRLFYEAKKELESARRKTK